MFANHRLPVVAALLLAGTVSAQLPKGKPAPALQIEKAWNGAPTSFDDFDGRVVILDFSQTW